MNELLKNPQVLREVIMDHYKYPHNKGLKDGADYFNIHMASSSCIDDLHIQIKFVDQIVAEVNFDGVGCAISTASTSIMSDLLQGRNIQEAQKILQEYYKMIHEEAFDEDLLAEAYAFHNVSKQANRIKCATIGIDGMHSLIEDYNNEKK
ncbi:MAG: Fe-S cluster assembly sulfur transfer protein SufU [Erysipelotrichaceae bacterium]